MSAGWQSALREQYRLHLFRRSVAVNRRHQHIVEVDLRDADLRTSEPNPTHARAGEGQRHVRQRILNVRRRPTAVGPAILPLDPVIGVRERAGRRVLDAHAAHVEAVNADQPSTRRGVLVPGHFDP